MAADRRSKGDLDFREPAIVASAAELRGNTLKFIEHLREMFGIETDRKRAEMRVRGSVTAAKIFHVYDMLPRFFPHNAPFDTICEDIAEGGLVGVYWGEPQIASLNRYVISTSLYTETLVITNPFCDLMSYDREHSPYHCPEYWVQATLNQALFLVGVEDWISAGLIHIVPPLKWFDNRLFLEKFVPLAKARIDHADHELTQNMLAENTMSVICHTPARHIESVLKSMMKSAVSEEMVRNAVGYAESEQQADPMRYLWAAGGTYGPQLQKNGSGDNLESAVYTATLCGGHLILGELGYRLQFSGVADATSVVAQPYTRLSQAFSTLRFQFLKSVPLKFALELRKDGRLSGFRSYLRDMYSKVSKQDPFGPDEVDKSFADELTSQYDLYKKEWSEIGGSQGRNFASAALAGATAVATGIMPFKLAAHGVAASGIKQLLDSHGQRKKHERLPLGVFLELDHLHQKHGL